MRLPWKRAEGYNFNLQGFAEMYQKEQYPDPVAIDVAPNISLINYIVLIRWSGLVGNPKPEISMTSH